MLHSQPTFIRSLLLLGPSLFFTNCVFAQPARPAAGFVEGKDYVLLKRVRFQDQMGFDRPVEAFSLLVPSGWKAEGGVKWGPLGGCRGEMINNFVTLTSPDGAYSFHALPGRSFSFSSDQMMLQAIRAGAQAGGCAANQPFNASQYIDGYARIDLRAKASNIQPEEASMALLRPFDQMANDTARQYGQNSQQDSTVALGDLRFSDGSEGILQATVTNIVSRKPDAFTGGVTMFSVTASIPFLMRFPAGRRAEGLKLFRTIMTSHRTSPIWKDAKERFMTQLGSIEHQGRMERIRLMGEQSRAYAREQSAASDQRMRDWENRQASQDRQHTNFVQAIREVETWRDSIERQQRRTLLRLQQRLGPWRRQLHSHEQSDFQSQLRLPGSAVEAHAAGTLRQLQRPHLIAQRFGVAPRDPELIVKHKHGMLMPRLPDLL